MADAIDIKKLFESGAYFGHKTSAWHPKMAKYIHSKKDGIHIINLENTVEAIEEAQKLIVTTVYKLIKEDPAADIPAVLTAAEEEYNAGG